nr:aminodeoxychorismate/anthranilate synthase component II [Calderihabitans maritimus]
MIDNYDSFTYNLVQYLGEFGKEVVTYRNDQLTLEAIEDLNPSGIVISPGPGRPEQAGISLAVIRHFGRNLPILGVCLGHQCIGQVYGGKVTAARELRHGKTSTIYHDGRGIFTGIPNPFTATRYHSLVVSREGLPECLEITAQTEDGEIMGIRHKEFPVEGVQFHPESIMTERGKELLANFLRLVE